MAYLVTDNAATTLAASITNSPSVATLTLTDASKFPIINHGGSGSDYTYVTLYDASGNIEVVKVTRRDNGSNNATILRGTAMGIANWTDSTCRSWALTTTGVACRLIAQTVNDMSALATSSAASASAAAASASAAAASAAASIPLTQKAAANGVASLDANSKVVQTALLADSATNATNATNATKLATANWVIEESGGVLYFKSGGANKAKLDASGNLVVVGDVTAYGTV